MKYQSLVARNNAMRRFEFTPAALESKQHALAISALVVQVTNADELRESVAAQTEVAQVLKLVETARKSAKEPVIDFGRMIDDKAREFTKQLKDEELRLVKLNADFEQLQQAKIRAAQQAENERLLQIEREKAAEIAKANSHDEINTIAERYDQRVKDEVPSLSAVPIRAKGQRITEDWEIEVTDIWALARSHPMCVTVEPRKSEIKALLNAGQKVAGVRATRKTNAGVSVRMPQAIEI